MRMKKIFLFIDKNSGFITYIIFLFIILFFSFVFFLLRAKIFLIIPQFLEAAVLRVCGERG